MFDVTCSSSQRFRYIGQLNLVYDYHIQGILLDNFAIYGTIKLISKTSEKYNGDYVIIPKSHDQKLNTQDKYMSQDLTVLAIPFSTVSNQQGGETVYIG